MMNQDKARNGGRNLASIESDLLSAEQAFLDADERYKKAESDRLKALDTINKHQMELDNFISELRELSVPGTRWHPDGTETIDTLQLHREDIVAEEMRETENTDLTSAETKQKLAKDFSRLRASNSSNSDDPVLKVVSGKG